MKNKALSRFKVVKDSAESMNRTGKSDKSSWEGYWEENFRKYLSDTTYADKDCPKIAMHGIWDLGLTIWSKKQPQYMPSRKNIMSVYKEYGKNVTYAFIAIILISEKDPDDATLWNNVKKLFNQNIPNITVATKDEGGVEFVLSLWEYKGLI